MCDDRPGQVDFEGFIGSETFKNIEWHSVSVVLNIDCESL